MACQLFYSDKSIFLEGTRLTEDVPRRGIQAIVQTHQAVGWQTESRGDYYLLKDDNLWHAADFDGLWTELKKRNLVRPRVGVWQDVRHEGKWKRVGESGLHEWIETLDWVLCGETIGNDRFQEVFQEALASADFGRKHGYLAGERQP